MRKMRWRLKKYKISQGKRPMNRSGVTLFEMVVAMTVVFIIFPSVMVIFQHSLATRFLSESKVIATSLASEIVEHLSQRRFSAIESMVATKFSDQYLGGGTSGTENPFRNLSLGTYTFSVTVTCVEDPGGGNFALDTWPVDASGCDYKRVLVQVAVDAGDTISVTTFFTDTSDV